MASPESGMVKGVHYSQLDETYFALHIDRFDGDRLSFVDKDRLDVKFDGKEYAEKGESVLPGTTISGRTPNLRTIELTEKHKFRGDSKPGLRSLRGRAHIGYYRSWATGSRIADFCF
jgi:hypothetical protein